MIEYLDVHSHLESERFNSDLNEVIKRAKEKKIQIIQSGVNPQTNRKSLEIKKKYNLFCSFGLYPIDSIASEFSGLSDDYPRDITPFDFEEELEWIKKNKDECILIGEIGLDYKVIECNQRIKEAQIRNFNKAINLAIEINKPVLIHSRGAELEAIEILEKSGAKDVIMHCFSGRKNLIKRAAQNGWFFSIPPIITRLEHFKNLVTLVPIDQILTETDSPYLSPVAMSRNEPINVLTTIKEIAKIKKIGETETQKKIIENAKRLLKF
jgi:TatD DNase family protein